MLEKLTFEIQESPVLYSVDGEVLTSKTHKVLSRSNDNVEISTMKNSYKPMLNSDFMETTERMKKISGFEMTGYSELDGGKIILSHLKNNLSDFNINGHKIEDYLLMGSSFDGRYSFFVGTTTVLLRCTNQFSRITQAEKVRHTKSAPKRIEELLTALEIYFDSRKVMYEKFQKMTKVKIDPIIRQMAVDYIMEVSNEDRLEGKISTRKANIIDIINSNIDFEMGDLGQNMWALLNGVTRYTTHERKQKEQSFGNVFGSGAQINTRMYQFANQFV